MCAKGMQRSDEFHLSRLSIFPILFARWFFYFGVFLFYSSLLVSVLSLLLWLSLFFFFFLSVVYLRSCVLTAHTLDVYVSWARARPLVHPHSVCRMYVVCVCRCNWEYIVADSFASSIVYSKWEKWFYFRRRRDVVKWKKNKLEWKLDHKTGISHRYQMCTMCACMYVMWCDPPIQIILNIMYTILQRDSVSHWYMYIYLPISFWNCATATAATVANISIATYLSNFVTFFLSIFHIVFFFFLLLLLLHRRRRLILLFFFLNNWSHVSLIYLIKPKNKQLVCVCVCLFFFCLKRIPKQSIDILLISQVS